MDEWERRLVEQAGHGDLRPQFNPGSLLSVWQRLSPDLKEVEKTLVGRFFQLSRPIADASAGPRPDMRLRDAGSFFYLLEMLRRVGHERVHDLLWVLLDEFANLDERSYDELYLWCIVELSRADPRAIKILWPQVLSLDLRYRPAPWQRPPGTHLVDQPYRLTELTFYFYEVYTVGRTVPLLGNWVQELLPDLSKEQIDMARQALQDLTEAAKRQYVAEAERRHDPLTRQGLLGLAGPAASRRRAVFSDALGLLKKYVRQQAPHGTGPAQRGS